MNFASAALLLSSVFAAPQAPPKWPNEYIAKFDEVFTGFPAPPSTGAWYYSLPQKSWRVDHDSPQLNNFCVCASNSTDTCSLLFSADGELYVNYPDHQDDCCTLCSAADGCGMLAPAWLSASNPDFNGTEIINGRECNLFCIPGATTKGDCMSYDSNQQPCRYSETFNFPPPTGTVIHNLTFSSWIEEPVASSVFAKPSPSCSKPCAKTYPSCFAHPSYSSYRREY